MPRSTSLFVLAVLAATTGCENPHEVPNVDFSISRSSLTTTPMCTGGVCFDVAADVAEPDACPDHRVVVRGTSVSCLPAGGSWSGASLFPGA